MPDPPHFIRMSKSPLFQTQNWLTKEPHPDAPFIAAGLTLLLFFGALLYFYFPAAQLWMEASGERVFVQREYWRLFTTLFAHGDLGHLLANAFLFVPLSYFLAAYFGALPFLALAFGMLTNWIVLRTLPQQAALIGISGVVSWMAAAWLTLFLLIDKRDRLRRRFGAALFLTLMLFVPETLRPEVSYFSHFVGYAGGVAFALLYYAFFRRRFREADVYEQPFVPEEENWSEEEERENEPTG